MRILDQLPNLFSDEQQTATVSLTGLCAHESPTNCTTLSTMMDNILARNYAYWMQKVEPLVISARGREWLRCFYGCFCGFYETGRGSVGH